MDKFNNVFEDLLYHEHYRQEQSAFFHFLFYMCIFKMVYAV